MAGRNKSDSREGPQKQGSRQLVIVLLVVAAVVIAATAYHLYLRREPQKPEGQRDTEADLAKSIRAMIENALAEEPDTSAGRRIYRELLLTLRQKAGRYIVSDPADVVVRPMLARVLLELEQVKEAEHVVDDLLRFAPGSAEGLWLKGTIMRGRRERGFMEFFRRASESPDADGEIWATYGQALLAEDRLGRAEHWLSRALQARREERAELTARDAEILYGLGLIEMRGERFARAAGHLKEAADLAPSRLDIALKLIEAHRREGRLDAAEQALAGARRRFRKWTDRAVISMELGMIRRLQKRWLDAGEAFGQAAKHPNVGSDAALEAAKCYYKAERYAMAMEHIDAVLEVRPYDPEALEWAGKIEDARFPRPR